MFTEKELAQDIVKNYLAIENFDTVSFNNDFRMLHNTLFVLYCANPEVVQEPEYLVKLSLKLDDYQKAFANAELIRLNGLYTGYHVLFKEFDAIISYFDTGSMPPGFKGLSDINIQAIIMGLNKGYDNNVLECGWYLFNQRVICGKGDLVSSKWLMHYIEMSIMLGRDSIHVTNLDSYRIFRLAQYYYHGDIVIDDIPVHAIDIEKSFYWYMMAKHFSIDGALRSHKTEYGSLTNALNQDIRLTVDKKEEIRLKAIYDFSAFCADNNPKITASNCDTTALVEERAKLASEVDSPVKENGRQTILDIEYGILYDDFPFVKRINYLPVKCSEQMKVNLALAFKNIGKQDVFFVRVRKLNKPKSKFETENDTAYNRTMRTRINKTLKNILNTENNVFEKGTGALILSQHFKLISTD